MKKEIKKFEKARKIKKIKKVKPVKDWDINFNKEYDEFFDEDAYRCIQRELLKVSGKLA